jgi:NADP-dependent 3-hydroxy acid dehydrogenase YdfG
MMGITSELGGVDILINSTGIAKRVPTMECSRETWNEIMNINLKGRLYGCQIFENVLVIDGGYYFASGVNQ